MATINKQVDGVVTANTYKAGVTTITASLNSMIISTTLIVTEASLQSIEIWPTDLPMAVGAAQRFFAYGLFSDGSFRDITDLVSLNSSNPGISRVNKSQDGFTYVESLSVGQTSITATYDGKISSTTVFVLPIQTLVGGSNYITWPRVGIDGNGYITAIWTDWFNHPEVIVSAQYEGNSWLPYTYIEANSQSQLLSYEMAFNENGQGLLLWSTLQGTFYANHSPMNGWQTPQVFIQDLSSTALQIAVDSSGKGLAAWISGRKVYTSVVYQ